jgi:hypothetical protein
MFPPFCILQTANDILVFPHLTQACDTLFPAPIRVRTGFSTSQGSFPFGYLNRPVGTGGDAGAQLFSRIFFLTASDSEVLFSRLSTRTPASVHAHIRDLSTFPQPLRLLLFMYLILIT